MNKALCALALGILGSAGPAWAQTSPQCTPDKSGFQWPIAVTPTKSFGADDGAGGILQGVLLPSGASETIRAMADGSVVYSGAFRSYGQLIIVAHDCGVHSVVGGMSSVMVSQGERVRRGEPIGKSPAVPSTVYVEYRRDGMPFDPEAFMLRGDLPEGPGQQPHTKAPDTPNALQGGPTLAALPPIRDPHTVKTVARLDWPLKGQLDGDFVSGRRNGLSIAAPAGTPVAASADGIVIYAGDSMKDLGDAVLIRHGNKLVTVYGHLSNIGVKRGQQVGRGVRIALSGKKPGDTSGSLYFEVRKDAAPVDPLSYLKPQ